MYRGFARSSVQSSSRSSTRSFTYKGSTRSFTRSSTYRGFTQGFARSSTYGGSTQNSASGPRYIPDTAMFTTSFHQICCVYLISFQSPPTTYNNYSERRPGCLREAFAILFFAKVLRFTKILRKPKLSEFLPTHTRFIKTLLQPLKLNIFL